MSKVENFFSQEQGLIFSMIDEMAHNLHAAGGQGTQALFRCFNSFQRDKENIIIDSALTYAHNKNPLVFKLLSRAFLGLCGAFVYDEKGNLRFDKALAKATIGTKKTGDKVLRATDRKALGKELAKNCKAFANCENIIALADSAKNISTQKATASKTISIKIELDDTGSIKGDALANALDSLTVKQTLHADARQIIRQALTVASAYSKAMELLEKEESK